MCAYFACLPRQGIYDIRLGQADESVIDIFIKKVGYLARTNDVLRLLIEYDASCNPVPLDCVIYHLKECLSNYYVSARVCILTTNDVSANWLGYTPWCFGKNNRLRIFSISQAAEAEAWLRGC
jgi:hypothetical protein